MNAFAALCFLSFNEFARSLMFFFECFKCIRSFMLSAFFISPDLLAEWDGRMEPAQRPDFNLSE
jgi:hypothetical protein